MNRKILIAYASKCGSTEEAAREIGKVLAQNGAEIAVFPARKVKDISPYDFVVLGTAVRIGKPLNEALGFAQKFRAELREKKVALFSVGLQMREDTAENREKAKGFLAPIIGIIGEPVSLGLFAGRIDQKRFGFFLRIFARMEKSGVFTEGDWRNWEEILNWAEELKNKF
ncbi:MAG: flavodoxin domain-containing protein [Candidatus Latescibacterota bacterium]